MSLTRSEITQCIFDSDAKPLPKVERSLDEIEADRWAACREGQAPVAVSAPALRVLDLLPVRRTYTTDQVARMTGIPTHAALEHLNRLWLAGKAERVGSAGCGTWKGGRPFRWRRVEVRP